MGGGGGTPRYRLLSEEQQFSPELTTEEKEEKWERARHASRKRKANQSQAYINNQNYMETIYPYLSNSKKKTYNTKRFHNMVKQQYNTTVATSKELHPRNEVFSLGAYTAQYVLGKFFLPVNERGDEFFSTSDIMKAQKYVNDKKMDVTKYSPEELYNILKEKIQKK